MLSNSPTAFTSSVAPSSSSDALVSSENGNSNKRKRRPAGTPDPDAEVVALSPKTLMESDRYICEICNEGFQRDQNLQMHRRKHKVPWKLFKRDAQAQVRKKVYVCPEPTCLYNDPSHALGDLVGIKKHFRRKHSNNKHWICEKCSKGYAVQSDYKAHLKTCGTRGHSCDCGRVFSRVESFIEHYEACNSRQFHLQVKARRAACSSQTASNTSPSSDANITAAALQSMSMPRKHDPATTLSSQRKHAEPSSSLKPSSLELQLLPSSKGESKRNNSNEKCETHDDLKLSIGSSGNSDKNHDLKELNSDAHESEPTLETARLREFASKELKLAMVEKAYAEEARREAKRQVEIAELEYSSAKKIRKEAQDELQKAQTLKEESIKKISSTLMQITCQACKQLFQSSSSVPAAPSNDTSLAMSYMSSATTVGEGEGE